MSNVECAYWAGIFDGEGTVQIKRSLQPQRRKNPNYSLQMEISQKRYVLLERAQDFFGVGNIINRFQNHTGYKCAFWTFYALSTNAVICLSKILPYLLLKKEHAQLGIEFQSNRTSYRGRRGLPDEELKLREIYYWKMRKLNKPDKPEIWKKQLESLIEG